MIKVPLLRHQRYISPSPLSKNQLQNIPGKKMSPFDTFDGHVMVNFIEVSTVSLITQKLFLDHLNNGHCLGLTP